MAQYSIPDAVAQVNLAQLHDAEGRAVYLPTPTVEWLRQQGMTSVTLTLSLVPGRRPQEWLTVAEAARQHMGDVDGISEREAYDAVAYACKAGQIISSGTRTRKRIEPVSFAAWRLRRREQDLAQSDADET